MTAATPTTTPTRKAQTVRTLRVIRWSEVKRAGLVEVKEGRRIDVYAVRRLEPGYAEHAFAWQKLAETDGGATVAESYAVAVERQGHACSCRGFEAHGNCRHAAGTLKMLALGLV